MILSGQKTLIDLPTDKWYFLLNTATCPAAELDNASHVCKCLQDLVATRHLWLAHLRGIPNNCAPDLPPHVPLESLDCIGLKTLVVRAVRGNWNWNSPSPKATRELMVMFNNPTGKHNLVVTEASLVSGGDYLVVQWSAGQLIQVFGYVQLIEVSNGAKIWIYPNPDSCSSSMLWRYGVDRISENVLRVATAKTDPSGEGRNAMEIKVFEINLCQRRSEEICDYVLDDDSIMLPHTLYLRGDHIVLVDRSESTSFLNWKSSYYETFKYVSLAIDEAGSYILRVTDVHQAFEAESGQERTPSTIDMDTSSAVTDVNVNLDSHVMYEFCIQACDAFWRQESNIDIHLLAIFFGDYGYNVMVLPYSFAPQTQTFEFEYTATLHLDGHRFSPGIFSSQSGRLAVLWGQGLDGFNIHRILLEEPTDGLRRMVLPGSIQRRYSRNGKEFGSRPSPRTQDLVF
ncbi:hypothetical protein DFH11DRAFT_1732917 [Phellopilus nigrolimitatus]|nr:hypothetical protein DFH11DRAFT_1732917 [Phellopilus nigrolimitatus]